MLTKNEITALSLSPTKKDFVQIWNELLEVAGKLSERWDPTSTNESDPGIVILKALTGIADKLNYNIDKNTLEAFMPTAAQEDSMRKLCEMLGYTMKYYRSAETTINIKYYNAEPSEEEANVMAAGLYIPKFTAITNSDQDISYFTTKSSQLYISADSPNLLEVPCMEGQLVKCESIGGTNVITSSHISENNRFYLPETQIAENGIFVYNVNSADFDGASLTDGVEWLRVDNLNTQAHGTRVFKFGYDSYEGRPYLEFPDDYSELFQDGLAVYYTRTSGAIGNISKGTLTQINLPSSGGWSKVSASSFSVENLFSATSGANPETIKQAYNNFKKTIGTFDTLVTCRDYMNKIYSMMNDVTGKSVVSNILVTDIRNDLNNAITICSCDDAGIFYKETPVLKKVKETAVVDTSVPTRVCLNANKPVYNTSTKSWHLGSENGMELTKSKFISSNSTDFKVELDGEVFADSSTDYYWAIKQQDKVFKTKLLAFEDINIKLNDDVKIEVEQPAITHFDLVFYPFKSYSQIKSGTKDIGAAYDASFTYHAESIKEIETRLRAAGIQNIAHNIKMPSPNTYGKHGDILCINNYLRLSATIATNTKVTEVEKAIIINNIKIALANAFNMRELDFGDEIPFDSIVEVIENADMRIRIASLNEPALYTTFSVLESNENGTSEIVEYAVASDWLDADVAAASGRFDMANIVKDTSGHIVSFDSKYFNSIEAKKIYNRLAVRNVLAGRVPLFNYNNTFKVSFSESAYQITRLISAGSKPAGLAVPTEERPFTIWTDNAATYMGQLLLSGSEDFDKYADNPYSQPAFSKNDSNNQIGVIVYTETKIPKEYEGILSDNVIKGDVDKPEDDQHVNEYITEINTSCKLFVDEENTITDVTLAEGEFVKFRAPNFTTKKTYPAYVNYHLDLAKNLDKNAKAAKAVTLYNALDSDDKWQKMHDYFRNNAATYLNKFTLSQTVSAFKAVGDAVSDNNPTITFDNDLSNGSIAQEALERLFALSGKIKLCNKDFKARLTWTPRDGEEAPNSEVGVNIPALNLDSAFISNYGALDNALASLSSSINSMASMAVEEGKSTLPSECAWTLSFDFECVPFELKSIAAWESFVNNCAQSFDNNYAYQIFDFKPLSETDTYLWRITDGTGYDIGKYITEDYRKLLKFSKIYFTAIQSAPLENIYIIEDFGSDKNLNKILDKEEYTLGSGDRLFIEYTPSSITDDTAISSKNSITEVYGEGTIIRPSGFANGLFDSAELASSPVKTVTFEQVSSSPINMFSLGANEQIEIRELAKVELSKDSFSGTGEVYFYKNFNNCPELEYYVTATDGSRINNVYTLKDGEYIFYTDKNKTDFAYYTSGTQVKLSGSMVLPKSDIIELSTIFDSGIQAIPWEKRQLEGRNGISFQEFQYITLGPGDTLNSVKLSSATGDDKYDKKFLDENWQYCDEVSYKVANAGGGPKRLQAVNVADRSGNGWEACATLELNVTPNVSQTLHRTDNVETSLILSRTNDYGDDCGTYVIAPPDLAGNESVSEVAVPVFFKTNVACQAAGNSITVSDLYDLNTTNSFQIRVFAPDSPTIVDVLADSVVPYSSGLIDFATWPGEVLTTNNTGDSWTQLVLSKLSADPVTTESGIKIEKALRLPVNTLHDTYCVFCIYLDAISALDSTGNPVWIEAAPGTDPDTVIMLNSELETKLDGTTNKLYLNQGINCIRVNKTCKLFIKTDHGTDGLLFFDEPRLVSSQELRYKDSNGNLISLYTNGLNLAQLGYLDTSYDNSGKIDEVTREALHKAYADKAAATVSKVIQSTHGEISADFAELAKLKTNVQTIVTAEELIAGELENIKQADSTQLDGLIEQYNKVSSTLSNEKALLDALKNNSKAEEIEQRIVELLSDLDGADSAHHKIMEKLSTLKSSVIARAKDVSDSQVLSDFSELAAKTDLSEPFKEVRALTIDYIEKSYQEQLTLLVNKLDSIVNSEDKNMLMAVLEELRAAELSGIQVKLQSLSERLNEILEQDSINNTLSEMAEAAGAADYVRLYSLIIIIEGLLETDGLVAIAAELSQLVADIDDESIVPLGSLVEELNNMIASLGSSSGNVVNSTLVNLSTKVKAYIKDGVDTVDRDIIDAVETIRGNFETEFKAKLNEIAASLEASTKEIEKDTYIKGLISAFNNMYNGPEDDSQVKKVTNNINAAITERKTRLDKAKSVTYNTWQNSSIKDFVSSAIITLWPTYFTTRLSELLTELETIFNSTLAANEGYSFDIGKTKLANLLNTATNTELTDTLLSIIIADTFKTLFDEVELALSENAQNNADKKLLAALSGFIENSSELREALKNKQENSVIQTLLEDWQNTKSIMKKQQLQVVLKDELNKTIRTDKQIFDIVSELLWPNIRGIEAGLDASDSFYTELIAAISTIKSLILIKDFGSIRLADDHSYLELVKSADFEIKLLDFKKPATSWLPAGFKASIDKLKLEYSSISSDTETLRDKPIKSNIEKTSAESIKDSLKTEDLKAALTTLINELADLEATDTIEVGYEGVSNTLRLEKQLLADIRKMDINKDFYYSAPVEDRLAIEFNESDKRLNTLMNPRLNYDINNINNCFVISKLDIDYVDKGKGIQIARSSRLS